MIASNLSTKLDCPDLDGHFLVRLARSWLGHLGASLDRDLASPGLLGVREDGPAGGGTWGDEINPHQRDHPREAHFC